MENFPKEKSFFYLILFDQHSILMAYITPTAFVLQAYFSSLIHHNHYSITGSSQKTHFYGLFIRDFSIAYQHHLFFQYFSPML